MKAFIITSAMLLILMLSVSAADTTAPEASIFLGQNPGQSNPTSNSLTVWAGLANFDFESPIDSCSIDWGAGWETVSVGTEQVFYSVSHTYASAGLKTVRYQCTSAGGASPVAVDTITINGADATGPDTLIYLGDTEENHKASTRNAQVFAKVWVHDAQTAVSCTIDWGEGPEPVAIEEGELTVVSHVYDKAGLKRVDFECVNEYGVISSSAKNEGWDDIRLISPLIKPANLFATAQESITVSRIIQHESCVLPGSQATFSGVFDDRFNVDIKPFHLTVSVPELGIRSVREVVDFDKGRSGTAILDLPQDIEDGEYWARISVSNDDFRRIVYRPLIVGGC